MAAAGLTEPRCASERGLAMGGGRPGGAPLHGGRQRQIRGSVPSHGARVLEVRIHLPPARSLLRTSLRLATAETRRARKSSLRRSIRTYALPGCVWRRYISLATRPEHVIASYWRVSVSPPFQLQHPQASTLGEIWVCVSPFGSPQRQVSAPGRPLSWISDRSPAPLPWSSGARNMQEPSGDDCSVVPTAGLHNQPMI